MGSVESPDPDMGDADLQAVRLVHRPPGRNRAVEGREAETRQSR